MIKNIIQLTLQPGKRDALLGLYERHFKALRDEGDKVAAYEIYLDSADETVGFVVKTFDSEADHDAHNSSPALRAFLAELKEVSAGPAQFHRCGPLISL